MKATGEVMSIGRTHGGEPAQGGALAGDRRLPHATCKKFDHMPDDDAADSTSSSGTDDRIFAIAQLIRRGVDLALICNNTKIDMLFLDKIKNIVDYGAHGGGRIPCDDATACARPSAWASADKYIGRLWGTSEDEVFALRRGDGHLPRLQDDRHLRRRVRLATCPTSTPPTRRRTSRIVERPREDHRAGLAAPSASARAWSSTTPPSTPIWTIRKAGYEAIIINNNPETVSTDYTHQRQALLRAAHASRT